MRHVTTDFHNRDSSFSSLLVKLSQVFESALLDNILKLAVIPVACAPFPIQFPFPIQSTLHLICFDTALLEQPPLSVMTLCDLHSLWRVSMIVFWTIAKTSSVPSLLWFQRTRDTQDGYCMDGHLLKLKCKYSNILRYWIMTFISCKL